MENLALKVKISALWFFSTVVNLVVMVNGLLQPVTIEQTMAEEIPSGILTGWVIFDLVPLVMALLSLTLKNSINRRANILLGIVFTYLNLVALTNTLVIPPIATYMILPSISIVLANALIVWYAWKWPKQEE